MEILDRRGASAILDDGHAAIRAIAVRLSPTDLTRTATIGGGTWSALDLIGHLTSWEAHALDALDAWAEGRPAPILRDLRTIGLTAVNARTDDADRQRTIETRMRRFDEVHSRLRAALGGLSAEAWSAPPTARSRRPTGSILGSILGGPGGPFRHAWAHLADLERYSATLAD